MGETGVDHRGWSARTDTVDCYGRKRSIETSIGEIGVLTDHSLLATDLQLMSSSDASLSLTFAEGSKASSCNEHDLRVGLFVAVDATQERGITRAADPYNAKLVDIAEVQAVKRLHVGEVLPTDISPATLR